MEISSFGIMLATVLATLLLVGFVGVSALLEKRARAQRVLTAVGKRSGRNASAAALAAGDKDHRLKKGTVEVMRSATGKVSIIKDKQARETKLMLVSAGYKSRDAIIVYAFFKLVAPLVFLGAAAIYVFGLDPIGKGPWLDFAAVMGAALFGSKLPDIVLKNKSGKRMEQVQKSLPDALDMLVICAEAGLASDMALKRVVAETSRTASVLGEELHQTAMELSFMPERRVALENLAQRVPISSVGAFVNSMVQAEKYGTPLAKAFKVLSQEQRTERMLRAEEKASRLPATMTVPMMMFILPALFIVLIGPAAIDIMDNFVGMSD